MKKYEVTFDNERNSSGPQLCNWSEKLSRHVTVKGADCHRKANTGLAQRGLQLSKTDSDYEEKQLVKDLQSDCCMTDLCPSPAIC